MRHSRPGVTRTVLAVTFVAVMVVAGCSDDGGGDVEGLEEALSSLGGRTVDDVSIVHETGLPLLSVGGIEISLPVFEPYEFYSDTITIPTTWPTLDVRDGRHSELFSEAPTVGVAVLAQTELVTDDDTRAELIADGFAVARFDGLPVVHESVTTDPDSGVTCWTEVRQGDAFDDDDSFRRSVIMLAGPGVASSGIIVWSGGVDDPEVLALAGDIVEQACGSRPEGL